MFRGKNVAKCLGLVIFLQCSGTVFGAASITTNGLITWLKADQAVAGDANGRVARWGDQSNSGNDAFAATDWLLLTGSWGADNAVHQWINGGAEAVTTGADAIPSGHSQCRIGAAPGAGEALDGDMAAVLVYNTELSEADRNAVEFYLEQKWLLGRDVTLPPANEANLVLWLESDDQVLLDDGEGVFVWVDRSPLGGDNSAGTALLDKKPDWVSSGSATGDKSVLHFDGDDLLNINSNSIFDTDTVTWFVVARTNTLNQSQRLFNASYSSLDGGATNPSSFDSLNLWGTFFDQPSQRYRSHARSITGSIRNPFPAEPILDIERRPLKDAYGSPMGDRPVLKFGERDPLFSDDNSDTFTWFVVMRVDDPTRTQMVFNVGYDDLDGADPPSHAGNARKLWGMFLENTRVRSFARTMTGSIRTPFPPNAATSSWTTITGMWGADDVVRQWTDGTLDNASSGADAAPLRTKLIRIGEVLDGSSGGFDGDIAAILVYDAPLSDPDRVAVEQYLNNKWITGGPALLTVTNDLVVRLEADQGVTVDAGGNVQIWGDQSGNGNDARQLFSGDRPALVANGSATGALPVVRFPNGAVDYLDIGAPAEYLNIPSSLDFDQRTMSWFVVYQCTDPGQDGTLLDAAYTDIDGDGTPEDNFASNFLWGTFLEQTQFKTFARSSSGSIRIASTISATPEWVIFSNIWDGNAGAIETLVIDPGFFSFPAFNSGANADPMFHKFTRIGAIGFGGARGLDGTIGEVLIYNRVVTPSERTAVEDYLLDKWFSFAADVDGDDTVDKDDTIQFVDCIDGPGVAPAVGCEKADIDCDGDVDMVDWASYVRSYSAP